MKFDNQISGPMHKTHLAGFHAPIGAMACLVYLRYIEKKRSNPQSRNPSRSLVLLMWVDAVPGLNMAEFNLTALVAHTTLEGVVGQKEGRIQVNEAEATLPGGKAS